MSHVIVVGAGNAALCAALAAREHDADVTVLEKAPEGERGGNTYFTGGGFRFPYDGMDDILRIIPDLSDAEIARVDVGAYPSAQFRDDLARVTDGLIDDGMASALVREAAPTIEWLHRQGVKFTLMTGRQANEVDGKLVFYGGLTVEAVGAGKGLSDQEFAAAEAGWRCHPLRRESCESASRWAPSSRRRALDRGRRGAARGGRSCPGGRWV